jgi:hypothetical protein
MPASRHVWGVSAQLPYSNASVRPVYMSVYIIVTEQKCVTHRIICHFQVSVDSGASLKSVLRSAIAETLPRLSPSCR